MSAKKDKKKEKKEKKKEKKSSNKEGMKMFQYKNGKQKKCTMKVGTEFITDSKHNNEKLVKLSKIEEIHLGKASKGFQKVKSRHNVCFSIINKKTFGKETHDFETKSADDRTDIIMKIMENMQPFGLSAKGLDIIRSNVIQNGMKNEILELSLDPRKIASLSANLVNDTISKTETVELELEGLNNGELEAIPEHAISEHVPESQAEDVMNGMNAMNDLNVESILEPYDQNAAQFEDTEWTVYWHTNGERKEILMVVGSEVIIGGEAEMNDVNLIEIQEIHLWNGPDGFQAVDSPKNVCFSIVHYNGTDWETLGFEMNSTEDRSAIITDIINKLECRGVYPAVEDGLSRQIVLDSLGLEETLQVRLEYYPEVPQVTQHVVDEAIVSVEEQSDVTKGSIVMERMSVAEAQIREQKYENYREMKLKYEAQMAANQDLKIEMASLTEEFKSDVDDTRKLLEEVKAKNEKQREDLDQKNEVIKKLQNEQVMTQKKLVENQRVEREALETKQKELMQQLAATDKKCQGMEQKYDSERKINQELRAQMVVDGEKTEARILGIEKLMSDLKETRSELKGQRAQNEAQRDDLDKRNAALEKLMHEREIMKKNNEELQQKWSAEMEKNEKLRDRMDAGSGETNAKVQALESDLVATHRDLKKEREDRTHEYEKYLHDRAVTESEKQKLQEELSAATERNEVLKKEMKGLRRETDSKIQQLKAELTAYRTNMDHAQENGAEEREQLNRKLSDKVKENENLKNQMDTLRQETSGDIEQLRTELREERSTHKMELDQFQEESMTKVEELKTANSDSLSTKMDELVAQRELAVEQRLKNEELEVQQMELVQQLAATEEKYHEIEGKYEAEQKMNEEQRKEIISDHEGTAASIERLNSDLDSIRSELKEQREQNEAQQQQLTEERAQNELYLRERVVMESKLVDEMQKSETLQKAISDLRDELAAHREEMDHIRGDSKGEREQQNREIMDKIKENEHLKNEIGTLRKESSAEIEQLQTTVDANKMEIESFIEKIGELQDSILIKDAELVDKNTDIERLQTVHDEMRADLEKLNETMNTKSMDQKVVELEYLLTQRDEDIDKLKESINNLRDEKELEIQRMKSEWDDHLRTLVTQHQELVEDHIDIQDSEKESVVKQQAELMQQLEDTEKQYEEMEHKYEAEMKARRALQEAMVSGDEKVMTELEQLKSDLDEQRAENETRRQELEQQSQIHEQLQQKLVIQKKEKEQLRQEWSEEMEALSEQSDIYRTETESAFQRLQSDLIQLREERATELDQFQKDTANTVEQLNKEMSTKMKENDELKNQIETLRQETSSKTSNEKAMKKLEQKNRKLEALVASRASTIDKLKSDLSRTKRMSGATERKQKKLEIQLTKMRGELHMDSMNEEQQLMELKKANADLSEKYSKLGQVLTEKNKKIEALKQQIKKHKKSTVNANEMTIEDLSGRNRKLLESSSVMKEQLLAQKKLLSAAKKKYAEIKNEFDIEKKENEDQKKQMVLDKKRMEAEVQAARSELKEQTIQNDRHKAAYKQLQRDLATMEEEKDQLRMKWIAESESMDKLADTRRLETESAIQRLKSNLDELRGELASQQMEMNQFQETATKTVAQFEQELTSKRKENDDLKNQMDTLLEETSAKIGELQSTIDTKRTEIQNLMEINNDLKDSVPTKDAALAKLQTELEREREIIPKLEEEVATMKQENYKLQNDLKSQMKDDQERADSEIEHLKCDLSELQEELTAHQMEMDKVQNESMKKREELKTANADLSGKCQRLERQLSEKMKESDFLKLQMDTVRKGSSSEIEWLRSTLDANNVTINNLTDKNRELQDSLTIQNEKLSEQKELVVQQQVEYEQLEVKQKELMLQLADTEELMQQLAGMKDKFEEQMKMYHDLKELIISISASNSDSDATRSELEELRVQKLRFVSMQNKLLHEQEIRKKKNYELQQKWTAEVKKNKMLSDQMNAHLEQTNSKVNALKCDVDDHRRYLKEERAQCERYLHQRQVTEGENHKLQEKLAAEIEKNEVLRNEMSDVREETSTEINQLRSTLDANGLEIGSLTKRIGELQNSVSEKDTEMMEQREELEGEHATNEHLQEKKAMLEQENQELKETLSMEIERSETLRSEMNLHRREAHDEIQRLKSALDDSRCELADRQVEMQEVQENFVMKHKDSMEEIKGNIRGLQRLVAARGATIEKLESDLSRMEMLNGELTEDNDENREDLKSQLARMEDENEEFNDLLRTKIGKIQQLKSELDDSRRELTNKITDIRRLREAVKNVRRNVRDLDERNHELEDSSSALSAAITNLQSERETMEKKNGELQHKLADEIEKNQALRNQIDVDRDKKDSEIQHLEANLNGLRVQLTAMKQRYHEIEPKYRRQSEQIVTARQETEAILVRLNSDLDVAYSKLEEQGEAQRQEVDQRAEAHAQLVRQYEIVKNENNDLKESNNELKAVISQINDEFLLQNEMMMKQRATSEQLNKKQMQLIQNELLAEQAMLKRQNDEVHDRYRQEADSEIQRLKSALDDSQQALAANQKKMDETYEKLEELQQQGAEHELLIQRLVVSTEVYTEMKKQYDVVMEINQDLRNHIANDREATKQKIEKLIFDLDAARMEVDELRTVSEAQQVLLDQQSEVNEQLQRELQIMDRKEPLMLNETDRLKEQVQLQEQAEIVREAQMKQRVSALFQESVALKGEMAVYRDTVDSRIKRLNYDLNDARNALELRRTQIEGQRGTLDQQSQVCEEVIAVKVMMEKENQRLYQELRIEQEKKIALQNQMDIHREEEESQSQRLKHELSDSRQEITAHQMEMDHLERTLNDVKVRMNPRCKNM